MAKKKKGRTISIDMPEVRFLRRLEQAALSWNNNRTKRGRLRGRLGVSGAPLTFAGPHLALQDPRFLLSGFGLALDPGDWLAVFARGRIHF